MEPSEAGTVDAATDTAVWVELIHWLHTGFESPARSLVSAE